MKPRRRPRPVILCILDGWGHREAREDNAIRQATTPVWNRLVSERPHGLLDASEHEVGLPLGQMGNSEVGHMNLGAGRVVLQDLPRIDAAIEDGSLARIPALAGFIDRLKKSGGAAHLLVLMSPAGVHSHQDHAVVLARLLDQAGVPVRVHAFLDGRDSPPRSAAGFLDKFVADTAGLDGLRVVTVGGRYWAMDRDRRWDRVARAYAALVEGTGQRAADPGAAVESAYGRDENDEFVLPTVLGDYGGMADGDGVLVVNYRADRVRQILAALFDPDFDDFARPRTVRLAAGLGMTEYSRELDRFLETLFPTARLENVLGEVVAAAELKQLRIAETEKYAHVTFFLNGGQEREFPGEERILVPSPRVATYDLKPEMSAVEVTDRLLAAVAEDRFDLIVVNYANTDMVGHTGDIEVTKLAVETVDACLGRIERAVREAGGALLITADHGNAEIMRDHASGQPHTAHTRNPVPVLLAVGPDAVTGLEDGRLADVAPTILGLLGLPQPEQMSGRSLLVAAAPERRQATA